MVPVPLAQRDTWIMVVVPHQVHREQRRPQEKQRHKPAPTGPGCGEHAECREHGARGQQRKVVAVVGDGGDKGHIQGEYRNGRQAQPGPHRAALGRQGAHTGGDKQAGRQAQAEQQHQRQVEQVAQPLVPANGTVAAAERALEATRGVTGNEVYPAQRAGEHGDEQPANDHGPVNRAPGNDQVPQRQQRIQVCLLEIGVTEQAEHHRDGDHDQGTATRAHAVTEVLPGPEGQHRGIGKQGEHPVLGPDRGHQQQRAGGQQAAPPGERVHHQREEAVDKKHRGRVRCATVGFTDMETGKGEQHACRPGHARPGRYQHQREQRHHDDSERTGERRVAARHHDMTRTVAVGFHCLRIAGDTGRRAQPQQIGQCNGLAADEGRVAEAVKGGPTGPAFIEIDQGKTAGVVPVPAQRLGAIQARQKSQQEQQPQAQQAPAAHRG